MEAYKLITRHSHGVVPPVVEYSCTDNGRHFALQAIGSVDWIERNIADIVGEG
ncbi:winged helix-turn-helix transcriptional regulator [Ruegeria arenilitoris]|uniref:winged helix-turn-helix transcriptional regulator n=1 Tax=Ruegeria arenilitoris TaxID=1173585 RepID=UPI00148134A6